MPSSSQLPLQKVPGPLALGAGPEQLVAFVIDDGIASTVYVPFRLKLPNAPAGPIRAVNANDMLTVLHRLSHVENKLLKRGSLVAASCAGEIRAVVLVGTDGSDHWS